MAKSQKPRKKYRPGRILLNPVDYAIEGASALDPKDAEKVIAGVEQSLGFLLCAENPAFHWRVLADALNVAETMSDMGICSDADSLQVILDAQAVLGTLAVRHSTQLTWAMHADEIAKLREGCARHAIQLRFISRSEYEEAIRRTRARVDAAKRGQGSRGVVAIG